MEDGFSVERVVVDATIALATVGQSNVIDIEIEVVGAVEVTDGDVSLLTSVSAEVNGVFVPVALSSEVTTAARSGNALTLSGHGPFLEHGEVAGVGLAASGNSHAEVLGCPSVILSASEEPEG